MVGLVVWDYLVTSELLQRVTAVGTLDAMQMAAIPAPGSRERSTMLLPGALDAKWYLIHAESFLRGDCWRIRWTTLDNAPAGREVHWASLLVWALGGWAALVSWFTGGTPADCVQTAALSLGPLTQFVSMGVLAWLFWRRFGAMVAAFGLLVLSTTTTFACMFQTGQVDHHGLVAAMCLASVFCLGAGSAGVLQQGVKPDGWWAAASGVFAGLGIWVSSATALPVIAACGPGWLLAVLAVPAGSPVRLWPGAAWRWAVAGAATSLACYLLEYFPGHMGWRLEVNHPIYSLAWLGAGWLLARSLRLLARWKSFEVEATGEPVGGLPAAVAALLALAAPVALVGLAGERVFLVSDPFLFALHQRYIREFMPVWRSFEGPDWPVMLIDLAWWPVLFATLAALLLRRRAVLPPWTLAALVLPVIPTLVAQAEAVMQVRWSGLASSLWIASLALAAGLAWQFRGELAWGRWKKFALGAWVILGVLPFPLGILRDASALEGGGLPKTLAPPLLLRDIAQRLVRSDPQKLPRVLSDPTSSSELAFYAGLPVIGTLYWENTPGLKRAARIFSAKTEAEARSSLLEAGVTHIVLPTWDAFADMDAYSGLLALEGGRHGDEQPYLAGVLSGENQPDWIRPIHYPIPAVFGVGNMRVDIVAFAPEQTPFEAKRARGLFEFERGDWAAAIRHFEAAMQIDASDPEIPRWLAALRKRVGAPPPSPAAP
jgi:hypothetical protein